MTERQRLVAAAIARGLNGISGAQEIAYRMGYRPARNGILACTRTLRSMEQQGLVGRIAPFDQWSTADWFLTDAGKERFNQAKDGRG